MVPVAALIMKPTLSVPANNPPDMPRNGLAGGVLQRAALLVPGMPRRSMLMQEQELGPNQGQCVCVPVAAFDRSRYTLWPPRVGT